MWAKISDDFFRHPRTVAAGRDARDLFLVSLAHCNEHLTDGFVASGYLRRLAADAEIDNAQESAQRLVDVGYWEECDGGWMVHDFLDYNPSRAEVLAEREKAAVRKERWKNGARNGVRNAVPNGEGTPSPVPVPEGYGNSLSAREADAPVEAAEPEPVGEAPPVQRKVRDLYIAFRSKRHPNLVPEEFAPAELRRALSALHDMEKAGATTEQVHRATAAAMRRASDPKFVTVQSVVDHWSALLEDDPPPRDPAPARQIGVAGAPRTTTRRLNYVPSDEESEREIREQLTAAANRRLQ